MEEIAGAYAAAPLSPAGTHEHAPSVFCPDFINTLASGSGTFSGRYGECLDLDIVSACFVLAVNDDGLTAGVYYNVIFGFIIRILYIFDIF